jgi:hypothetical protein
LVVFQVRPLRLVEVLPSLNVPVAVNLIDVPFAIRALLGLMAIETKRTFATVSVAEPLAEPSTAVIVLPPAAKLVAKP